MSTPFAATDHLAFVVGGVGPDLVFPFFLAGAGV